MGTKGELSRLRELRQWIRRQSMRTKIILGVVAALISLVCLRVFVRDRNHFFVASEAIHTTGIFVLIYKLTTKKSCSGLSLKSQELTAIFLTARLICSVTIEADIHTILDSMTLISTLWVIYTMRFKLKSTYIKELDTMPLYYVILPCAIISAIIHPGSLYPLVSRIMWSFCTCLEAVSVLPQLRYMQNAKVHILAHYKLLFTIFVIFKDINEFFLVSLIENGLVSNMVEPFTAHYVFALGIARFLACAHWIFQIYDTRGLYLFLVGKGHFWILLMILGEIVQTFILADFCYYYLKRLVAISITLFS
ncbi:hypothetical protein Cgig2_012044 [Carnegiea gigantea]|uniref:ER lumen protein retaining receptor n=1 Tax=Carnegiea gigantea TaxID=171969 RepID=A0A9Q1KS57_9CARY|nr:hypothetical protein Cgig2_012044 [Carnegiea gigantea]